jgi:hypothetical protein
MSAVVLCRELTERISQVDITFVARTVTIECPQDAATVADPDIVWFQTPNSNLSVYWDM